MTQCRRGRGHYRRSSNRGSSSHGPTSGDQTDRGGSRGDYYSIGRGGCSHRKSSNRGGFSQHGAMNTCRNSWWSLSLTDFSDGVDDVHFVFAVSDSVTKTLTVETRICDTNISVFIDTGASVNITDYQSYQKIYLRPKLQPHSPMIYAYGSQSVLPLIGNFSTHTQKCQHNVNILRCQDWLETNLWQSSQW